VAKSALTYLLTFCEGKCEVTKEHLAEVERVLRQHLPAKLDGRWRVVDIYGALPSLCPSIIVWLD